MDWDWEIEEGKKDRDNFNKFLTGLLGVSHVVKMVIIGIIFYKFGWKWWLVSILWWISDCEFYILTRRITLNILPRIKHLENILKYLSSRYYRHDN